MLRKKRMKFFSKESDTNHEIGVIIIEKKS